MITPYHSAYYAHELTKRNSSDDPAKLGRSLFNATVDLNPHQLDAALFAFRSPLSRGAILADEVGLGKTIEAGLIISQLWSERRRRILVIAPTMLRKQWAQELIDKFHIQSLVVDSREYKKSESPFHPDDKVVICSYHFACARETELLRVPWDLVVVDEAHRLRNVYKSGNKIATSIKRMSDGKPKILLTATPLQNSLLELFGLVSFLDEHLFGDINAFRAHYMRGPIQDRELGELRHRILPICQRTLRRQVTEYISFTNRIPITVDFTPTPEEQQLYDRVSEYLRRDVLHALPSSQRKLMTLVLRKLLASSTFAIAKTLDTMALRLKSRTPTLQDLTDDFDALEEIAEEWSDEVAEDAAPQGEAKESEIIAEIVELGQSGVLAKSITTNAKGDKLLQALQMGFTKLDELQANRKAVIFTESRRTQQYLLDLLNRNGYEGRVVTISGVNSGEAPNAIYKAWVARHRGEQVVTGNKAVDIKAALVEQFETEADILVATEAAAEGVNLQFCSLVVNYDLPWNPQRIEQRIGRCHRYGQKHDVVVINFLNRSNAADLRVFELLDEKFRLFDGVFGSSDEILGALESGVDFERRVADIYQNCRTREEIDDAFNRLRFELEDQIRTRMDDTRVKLLENFDEDVRRKLRLNKEASKEFLGKLERFFWGLTKHELAGVATFDDGSLRFTLDKLPKGCPDAPLGEYQFSAPGKSLDGMRPYRLGDGLAEYAIGQAKDRPLPPASITFDYSGTPDKVSLVDELVGKSGWLSVTSLTVSALEAEDRFIFAGICDDGDCLHHDAYEKLFMVGGQVAGSVEVPGAIGQALSEQTAVLQEAELSRIANRNKQFFEQEIDKLERWAEDLKHGLEAELKDLDAQIKQASKDAKLAETLEAKLEIHRQKRELEAERSKKRRALYDAQDDIDSQKEELIANVEARLRQEVSVIPLFSIRWSVA